MVYYIFVYLKLITMLRKKKIENMIELPLKIISGKTIVVLTGVEGHSSYVVVG